MLSHIVRPLGLLALTATLAAGCASPKPGVKVLGVSDDRRHTDPTMLVFLEVTNPTQRNITLSGLEYELRARPWFDAEGRLAITRSVPPAGSTVLEIPVRLEQLDGSGDDVAYEFRGRLYATDGNRNAEYPIRVRGSLSPAEQSHQRSARLAIPDRR